MEQGPDKASRSYIAAYRAVRIVSAITGRMITSIGLENLPEDDPYILAYTHHNSWDVPALGVTVYEESQRPIYFLAKEELLATRGVGRALKSMHALPVSRSGKPDISQIRRPIELLQAGHILGIAPEGRRVNGNRVAEIKGGVGLIATKANVDVIPVGIAGRNHRLSGNSLPQIPRSLHVHFGERILVDREPSRRKAIDHQLPGALQSALNAAYIEYNEIHGQGAASKLDYNLDTREQTL